MRPTYRRNDVGFALDVDADIAAALQGIFESFEFQRDDSFSGCVFKVTTLRDLHPGRNGLQLSPLGQDWFGCRITGLGATLAVEKDERRLLIDGDSNSVVLTLPNRTRIDRGQPDANLLLLVSFALVFALQRSNRYALHGAAVCDDDGHGVVVIGDSDTGKSTLTMSLVRQGWNYLSDDSILVDTEDSCVTAQPFRTDFGLDPDAVHIFPEIADHAKPWLMGGDKWRIGIRELFPSRHRQTCIPRVIVFPKLSGGGRTAVEPISNGEATALLLKQGSFLFTSNQADWAKRQLDAFGMLTSQCRSFRMLSGTDIMDEPREVSDMIRGLLAEQARSLPAPGE